MYIPIIEASCIKIRLKLAGPEPESPVAEYPLPLWYQTGPNKENLIQRRLIGSSLHGTQRKKSE